jgi:hypothetical protein
MGPREPQSSVPFFTPKFTAAEVDGLLEAVNASLKVLHPRISDSSDPQALSALEALEAARAKLLTSREGLDLASGQHYTLEQLSEMGELGA